MVIFSSVLTISASERAIAIASARASSSASECHLLVQKSMGYKFEFSTIPPD